MYYCFTRLLLNCRILLELPTSLFANSDSSIRERSSLETAVITELCKYLDEICSLTKKIADAVEESIIDSTALNTSFGKLKLLLESSRQIAHTWTSSLASFTIQLLKTSASAMSPATGLIVFLTALRSLDVLLSSLSTMRDILTLDEILWVPACFHLLSSTSSPFYQMHANGSRLMQMMGNPVYTSILTNACKVFYHITTVFDFPSSKSLSGDILLASFTGLHEVILSSSSLSDAELSLLNDAITLSVEEWRCRKAVIGETTDQPWEERALHICTYVILNPGGYGYVLSLASAALHWYLQGRTKRSAATMMQTILQADRSLLHRLRESIQQPITYSSSTTTRNWSQPVFIYSLIAKIMDVFFHSSSSLELVRNLSPTSMKATAPSASVELDESETAMNREEADELQEEHDSLVSVLGADYLDHLSKLMNEDYRADELLEDEIEDMRDVHALIAWLLALQMIDIASTSTKQTAEDTKSLSSYHNIRALCGSYLRRSKLSAQFFRRVVDIIPEMPAKPHPAYLQLNSLFYQLTFTKDSIASDLAALAAICFYRTVHVLPALVRNHWLEESSRLRKDKISKFIIFYVRNSLVSREIKLIQEASAKGIWQEDEIIARGTVMTGEVIATFMHDEAKIEIKIKLPMEYPLKNVEVEGLTRMGVDESRWRRWVLQIVRLLSLSDGTLVDAVSLWKTNLKSELSGVEPCPICYNTLHPKTLALPSLSCPTCKNKFHSTCLSTWFKSSGKNKCVLCQQPFFNKHTS
jgi:hypothetical protein